jgi:ethanolamine utilization protein EutA
MNIDVGGGTSKIAVCEAGDIVELTAVDVGARVICVGEDGRVTRIEEAGKRFAAEFGLDLDIGSPLSANDMQRISERMADRLFEAVSARELSPATAALIRVEPLRNRQRPEVITFSGGVSEYVYGREKRVYGDLGQPLAAAIRKRIEAWGVPIETPEQGIRATVVGASQYTVQVSGSTIYVTPPETLPLRNLPVIVPDLPLEPEDLVPDDIARATESALRRNDLADGEQPVALCFHWEGSATYRRLDDFCKGVTQGLRVCLDQGHPLVLVSDGDVGGLIGIHAHEEAKLDCPIVSIDGIQLEEFDFIDIGALLEASGAVPVVIKSLVFPTSAAVGRVGAERVG